MRTYSCIHERIELSMNTERLDYHEYQYRKAALIMSMNSKRTAIFNSTHYVGDGDAAAALMARIHDSRLRVRHRRASAILIGRRWQHRVAVGTSHSSVARAPSATAGASPWVSTSTYNLSRNESNLTRLHYVMLVIMLCYASCSPTTPP